MTLFSRNLIAAILKIETFIYFNPFFTTPGLLINFRIFVPNAPYFEVPLLGICVCSKQPRTQPACGELSRAGVW